MRNGQWLSTWSPANEEVIFQFSTKRKRESIKIREWTSIDRNSEYCESQHPFESQWELWGSGAIHNTDEEHSYVQTEAPVRKAECKMFGPKFGKNKIQRQISISERYPDGQQNCETFFMHHLWSKVYRVEWGARRDSMTQSIHISQGVLQDKQDIPKMFIQQYVSRSCVFGKATKPRLAWWYIPKKGSTQSTVAPLYTWWDHLFWIMKRERLFGQWSNVLDIQTANGIVVSDTQAKVYIKEFGADLLVQLVKDSPPVLSFGKIMQWVWLFLFVGVRRTFQITKREERDRTQHRKFRLCGCSYQTEA